MHCIFFSLKFGVISKLESHKMVFLWLMEIIQVIIQVIQIIQVIAMRWYLLEQKEEWFWHRIFFFFQVLQMLMLFSVKLELEPWVGSDPGKCTLCSTSCVSWEMLLVLPLGCCEGTGWLKHDLESRLHTGLGAALNTALQTVPSSG